MVRVGARAARVFVIIHDYIAKLVSFVRSFVLFFFQHDKSQTPPPPPARFVIERNNTYPTPVILYARTTFVYGIGAEINDDGSAHLR